MASSRTPQIRVTHRLSSPSFWECQSFLVINVEARAIRYQMANPIRIEIRSEINHFFKKSTHHMHVRELIVSLSLFIVFIQTRKRDRLHIPRDKHVTHEWHVNALYKEYARSAMMTCVTRDWNRYLRVTYDLLRCKTKSSNLPPFSNQPVSAYCKVVFSSCLIFFLRFRVHDVLLAAEIPRILVGNLALLSTV